MRIRTTGVIIFLILYHLSSICRASSIFHRVVFVHDGDTVLLENGDRVRYAGIDCPEIDHEGGKSQFMALAAREFNGNLLKGRSVRLEYDVKRRDRYGRILAYVFLRNGDMVNTLIVGKGLAHVLSTRPNLRYRGMLVRFQRKAMEERLGIWSRPLKSTGGKVMGSRRSFRFHRPDCPAGRKISGKNLIRFRSAREAFWEGYSPCKRCNPGFGP
ncbi:MAG: thermonuclease family protein [Deltaproteobacteria bacterium]|nr:thermonuclease family protein [Deltaproteobacteria bacterium]